MTTDRFARMRVIINGKKYLVCSVCEHTPAFCLCEVKGERR